MGPFPTADVCLVDALPSSTSGSLVVPVSPSHTSSPLPYSSVRAHTASSSGCFLFGIETVSLAAAHPAADADAFRLVTWRWITRQRHLIPLP